ncbi:toll/interleukin-1 receptor domain-containing protein [Heliobacterium chlorum]|uniref:toll/interleukin-1 receptor domain-containing protein n=1 Tax=Heliobacterium chlorum TaxID=2698 RepID=UPI00311A9901
MKVWYDDFNIELGDSLNQTINKGLSNSRYGIVILSHNFFKKEWPIRELNALLSKEKLGEKVILPVLHNISIEEIKNYSLLLADKAGVQSKKGLDVVVKQIMGVVSKKPNFPGAVQEYIPVPNMNFNEIIKYCKTSSYDGIKKAGEQLEKFIKISEIDLELAFLGAQHVVSLILIDVYFYLYQSRERINSIKDVENANLLCQVLGKNTLGQIKIIYNLGDIALRNNGFYTKETINQTDLNVCKQSLKGILNWYFNSYYSKKTNKDRLCLVKPGEFYKEDIQEIYTIESKFFDPSFISPVEVATQWYEHNNKTLIGVRDTLTGKLVGFLCTLPITNELFEKISSGEYIDTHISTEDIRLYNLPDFYKLYLCSLCVDPEYTHTSALRLIYRSFIEQLFDLAVYDEIYITDIVADAISSKGEELCKFIRMKFYKNTLHGTKIYKDSLLPPSVTLKGREGLKLMNYYKMIYEQYIDLL